MKPLHRRSLLRHAAGAGALLLGPGALAQAPPAKPGAPPPQGRAASPPATPRPVWLNYQYAIAWERMNALEEIVSELVDKGDTELTLLISSSGGDLGAAISCYEFLTSAGIKLTTYMIGNCYSAALLLFLAGERRVCDKPGQFIIHPAAAALSGSSTLDGLQVRSESLDRDTKRMRDIVVARTRMTAAQLEPMLTQHATFLDPQQALADGIVTQVAHLDRPSNAILLNMPVPRGQ